MKWFDSYRGLFFLTLLIIVLPLCIYKFALRETVKTWSTYRSETVKIAILQQRISPVRQLFEVSNIEQLQSGLLLDSLLPLLDSIEVTVENYTPFTGEVRNGYQLQTTSITLSGTYISIVRMIDYIERNISSCRLISVNFRTEKRSQTNPTKLKTILIIQQITKCL